VADDHGQRPHRHARSTRPGPCADSGRSGSTPSTSRPGRTATPSTRRACWSGRSASTGARPSCPRTPATPDRPCRGPRPARGDPGRGPPQRAALHRWFEYGFMAAHKDTDNHLREMKPDWLSRDIEGNEVAPNGFVWMNPLHPEARRFLLDIILEAVDRYDLDGVQLDDRIVWPYYTMGYDDFTVAMVPQRARRHAPAAGPPRSRLDALARRQGQRVQPAVRARRSGRARPGLIVSLSPAPYPWCYENYLLEWPKWALGAGQHAMHLVGRVHPAVLPVRLRGLQGAPGTSRSLNLRSAGAAGRVDRHARRRADHGQQPRPGALARPAACGRACPRDRRGRARLVVQPRRARRVPGGDRQLLQRRLSGPRRPSEAPGRLAPCAPRADRWPA
jgi:hypothetical protein